MADQPSRNDDIARVIQSALSPAEVLMDEQYVYVHHEGTHHWDRYELPPEEELKIMAVLDQYRETGQLPEEFTLKLRPPS